MQQKLMIEYLKNSIKELREEKFNDYRKTDLEKASLDFVDIIEQQNNEVIEMLEGLVSDVGSLLCDIADLDFEWQQAGYYESAKVLLKRLKEPILIKQSKEEIRNMFFEKIKVPENIDELHEKSLKNIQKNWCNCAGKKYSRYVHCPEHDK